MGARIKNWLIEQGYDAKTLPDRQWVNLSDQIKIFCITTIIQDAILLVDVNGRLFVNLNDAGSRGCAGLIKKTVQHYRHSYLLRLAGRDADMNNFFTEDGRFIELGTYSAGDFLSTAAKKLGVKNVILFSAFHPYQREDSLWAEKYTTSSNDYPLGYYIGR